MLTDESTGDRVLVVDDESSVTDVVRAVLEAHGHTVHAADSAEAALAQLVSLDVDAVVTDIRMGGMDGFTLAARLRELDPTLRVIAMTAHDSYESLKSALDAGMHGYLQKPLIDHDALVLQVERACDATRMERTNHALMKRLRASLSRVASMNETLEERNRTLAHIAITDALTGLHNRAHMDTLARDQLAQALRERAPISLLQIEIDRFKTINERFGHAVGDETLRRCGTLLQETLQRVAPGAARLGRLGGTSFLVVLQDADPARAIEIAERLRHSIATLTAGGTRDMIHASASIGATSLVPDAQTTDADADPLMHRLFREVGRALGAAKSGGRNRVIHHAPPTVAEPAGGDPVTDDEPSDEQSELDAPPRAA